MLTRPLALGGLVLGLFGISTVGDGGFGPVGATAHQELPPPYLILSDSLLQKLSTLAGGLHSEVILCLSGSQRGDTATAADFHMPVPIRSTKTGAAAGKCPDTSLALWHNHPVFPAEPPPGGAGERLGRPERLTSPSALCTLSPKDVEVARSTRMSFMVVAVDDRTWCWWNLDQIDGSHRRGPLTIPAIPGQLSWD